MKPRSLSPVAAVNSTSKVIRSSVAPDRVGHHRGRLGEHLALRRTLSARPGVSGPARSPSPSGSPPISYVEQSTDSVIRISSTRSHDR
jgi:hypothetical protein